jgi:hypothetical protein
MKTDPVFETLCSLQYQMIGLDQKLCNSETKNISCEQQSLLEMGTVFVTPFLFYRNKIFGILAVRFNFNVETRNAPVCATWQIRSYA